MGLPAALMRALAVIMAFAWGAAASEGITITLRENATVPAAHATLADIATIAADEATVARLGVVAVQELPDLGTHTVTPAQVRSTVGRLVAGRPLAITGSCLLVRASATILPEAFAAAAERAVRVKVGTEARIVVARPAIAVLVPDDAAIPYELVADTLVDDPLGEVPVRLRVLRAGRELGRGLVVLQVRVLRDQVVVARALTHGAILGLDDLSVESREARPGDGENPTNIAAVLGWQTRASIVPGTVLTRRLAQPLPAVRGGRAVELVIETGTLALTAPGVALSDGAIGDVIQVRRTTDNRTVSGAVVAEGRVRLGH